VPPLRVEEVGASSDALYGAPDLLVGFNASRFACWAGRAQVRQKAAELCRAPPEPSLHPVGAARRNASTSGRGRSHELQEKPRPRCRPDIHVRETGEDPSPNAPTNESRSDQHYGCYRDKTSSPTHHPALGALDGPPSDEYHRPHQRGQSPPRMRATGTPQSLREESRPSSTRRQSCRAFTLGCDQLRERPVAGFTPCSLLRRSTRHQHSTALDTRAGAP
jgi:hypothetical protein